MLKLFNDYLVFFLKCEGKKIYIKYFGDVLKFFLLF